MTYADSSHIDDEDVPTIPLEPEEAEVLAVQVRAYIARMHKRYMDLLIYGQLLRQQHPDEDARSRDVERTLVYVGNETDRLRRNASLTYREALALSLPIYPQT